MASGVFSWIVLWRMIMLTWSAMPTSAYAATESGSEREIPNSIVASPKMATAISSTRPVCFGGGQDDQDQRHEQRAGFERARQDAVAHRVGVQHVDGIHRQQRSGSAEQDREHVERHGARAAPGDSRQTPALRGSPPPGCGRSLFDRRDVQRHQREHGDQRPARRGSRRRGRRRRRRSTSPVSAGPVTELIELGRRVERHGAHEQPPRHQRRAGWTGGPGFRTTTPDR